MGRRSRAGQVAFVIVLTARRDEVQRTSGVRFDTRQCAEVCQTWRTTDMSETASLCASTVLMTGRVWPIWGTDGTITKRPTASL